MGLDVPEWDALEIEPLAPGKNRGRYLVDFCRGEYEYGVRGRLFQGLQKGVKGGRGKHVDFVNYVDFVLALRGDIPYGLGYLPDIVDAVVGRAVYLEDIYGRACGYALAGLA